MSDWETWERIPADVLFALEQADCEPFEHIVAGANAPTAVQRDGRRVELAEAWAVEDDALTLVEAVRPAGVSADSPWQLMVRRFPFVGEVRDRVGTLPADAEHTRVDGRPEDTGLSSPGVLAVLPQPVRRQVHDTVRKPAYQDEFLLQHSKKGKPWKQEAGVLRATDRMLIAIRACREVEPHRRSTVRHAESVLATTPWRVQALTAQLGPAQTVHLSMPDPPLPLAGQERRAALLPASDQPRRLG
ncbi:hypothetical protein [Jiangella gansuensis]|uniref:hypothetical protein n=1 Tax=Jiangella gansuensis TaxID=281473 RepID=UPI0004BBB78D|nr:hypothetical protein [Jiangella gansuensis]